MHAAIQFARLLSPCSKLDGYLRAQGNPSGLHLTKLMPSSYAYAFGMHELRCGDFRGEPLAVWCRADTR